MIPFFRRCINVAHNPILRAVIEQNPVGKRLLGRCHKKECGIDERWFKLEKPSTELRRMETCWDNLKGSIDPFRRIL